MESLIRIANAGPKIKETNFWESEYNQNGILFLSVNAGTIRLLVPTNQERLVPEMKTGKCVILSRGPWYEQQRTDAFEIMFEDYSENPFTLYCGTENWALTPQKPQNGRSSKWKFSVWTKNNGMVHNVKCRYRLVNKLPCLKAW